MLMMMGCVMVRAQAKVVGVPACEMLIGACLENLTRCARNGRHWGTRSCAIHEGNASRVMGASGIRCGMRGNEFREMRARVLADGTIHRRTRARRAWRALASTRALRAAAGEVR